MRGFWATALQASLLASTLASSPTCANPKAQCHGIEVLSVTTAHAMLLDRPPERIVVSDRAGVITAIAVGPMLDSRDSDHLETNLSCGPDGPSLTVTITRDAKFTDALHNVPWVPKATIELVLHQPQALLRAIWAMRLSDGTVRDYYADVVRHGERKYPITVTKILSRTAAPGGPSGLSPGDQSWGSRAGATSGGTAALKNALPPDPGTNTGHSSLVSMQTKTGYNYNGIAVTAVNGVPVPMSVASIQINAPATAPAHINPRSSGVLPVAILSTPMLAASDIDPTSVRFGPKKATNVSRPSLQDINGDGQVDLVLHFRTQGTGLGCSDVSAVLTGNTVAGQTFAGSEDIVTVGCSK